MTNNIISFLIENKYIDNLPSHIVRICQGTESQNYIIKNGDKKIVYKIMDDSERLGYIVINSNLLNGEPYIPKILSPIFIYQGQEGILMEYRSGKILKPAYLTESVCHDLVKLYQRFSKCINQSPTPQSVMPANDLIALKNKAIEQLSEKQLFWTRPFVRYLKNWLSAIPNEAINHTKETNQVIHGDFKPRNILIDKDKALSILDIEGFMFGHPAEDWARFIMRSVERLMDPWRVYLFKEKQLRLFKENLSFTQDEWALGYYNFLIQKIEKKSHKPLSLYQCLNLMVIIHYATTLMYKKTK